MRVAKRRFPTWGDFLREKRENRFRSAREFCSRMAVGISYPQYSRDENGEQLPSLEQALRLCECLEISPLEGVLEWNRAQLRDESLTAEIERMLSSIRGASQSASAPGLRTATASAASLTQPRASAPVPTLDEAIVFNRSHLKLFRQDPRYRDIFTYVNSFGGSDWILLEEMAAALDMDVAHAGRMVSELADLGVLSISGEGPGVRCRASKKVFYFPDDQDFFQLRNENFAHNARRILERLSHGDLSERRASRGVYTRELTSAQVEWVVGRLERLTGEMMSLPEDPAPERVYSLCLAFGESFRRPVIHDLRCKEGPEKPGIELASFGRQL